MIDFAIYTVCTGHYRYGLYALLKSLRKYGYSGPVIIATDKPFTELQHLDNIQQVVLQSKHVFGNLKARIVLEHPAERFLYLDPDIIQTHPDFITIVKQQLAANKKLIVSGEGLVPRNDMKRWIWNSKMNVTSMPLTDVYYSGGLLAGVFETHKHILENWDASIHQYIEPGRYFQACPEFPLADQDVLNAVLQNVPQENISCINLSDWKGTATSINPFHEFMFWDKPLFVHATGKLKTWLLKELPLRYPNFYDVEFYKYHIDPILNIPSDLTFTWLQKKWLTASRLLPFYNKVRFVFSLI